MNEEENKIDSKLTSLDNNNLNMSKEEIESALNKFKDILKEMKIENNTEIDDSKEEKEDTEDLKEEFDGIEEDDSVEENIEQSVSNKNNKLKIISIVCFVLLIISFSILFILKKWDRKLIKLNVTFETNGGSDISEQKIEYNSKASVPLEPIRIGYLFDGWYLDGYLYDFDSPVKKDIKLIAHWIEYEMLPVKGIKLDQDKATIKPNTNLSLVAYVEPFNARDRSVKWSSSNEEVAIVDEKGNVKALKEGTAIITAESVEGGFKATCNLTVSNIIIDVDKIILNKSTITLSSDTTYKLEPIILPSNATNKGIIWTSSDESVATVINGVITAHKDGEAIITATSKDGNKSVSVIVYVKNIPLTGVKITGARDISLGSTLNLYVQFTPVNSTEKNLSWSSSNKKVITIDKNGVVNAVGVGSSIITVQTLDGKLKDSVTIKVTDSISVYNITLDKKELSLYEGESSRLKATLYPSNAKNKNIVWTSSDESVATVDAKGNIKALKEGTTIIRAISSDGGFKATCNLKVLRKEKIYTYSIENKKIDDETYFYIKVYENDIDITNKVRKIAGIDLESLQSTIVIININEDKITDIVEIVIGEETVKAKKISS